MTDTIKIQMDILKAIKKNSGVDFTIFTNEKYFGVSNGHYIILVEKQEWILDIDKLKLKKIRVLESLDKVINCDTTETVKPTANCKVFNKYTAIEFEKENDKEYKVYADKRYIDMFGKDIVFKNSKKLSPIFIYDLSENMIGLVLPININE